MVLFAMTATTKRDAARQRSLLGRDQWIGAAVDALIRGGLSAVAVEPLAVSLGVTKGSFYWHFENRDALIAALLEQWELLGTERIIAELDAVADPAARLRALLQVSLRDVSHLRAEASLSAAARAGDPLVAPVVERVMRRRLAYTAQLYTALGVGRAEAARMAVVAYGAYLGGVQLAAQGLLGTGERALRSQIATFQTMLMPPR